MQLHHVIVIGPAIVVGLCIIFAGVSAIRTGSIPQRNSTERLKGPEAVQAGWAYVSFGTIFVVFTIAGGIYRLIFF